MRVMRRAAQVQAHPARYRATNVRRATRAVRPLGQKPQISLDVVGVNRMRLQW
jgi:hypothetical protein